MNRIRAILSTTLFIATPLGVAVAMVTAGDAHAQDVAPPPAPSFIAPPSPPVSVVHPPPPPAYVATTRPDYYEGRAVYFYDGKWYYRDEHGWNGWNYYRTEPAYLLDRRAHWNDGHRHYHYRS